MLEFHVFEKIDIQKYIQIEQKPIETVFKFSAGFFLFMCSHLHISTAPIQDFRMYARGSSALTALFHSAGAQSVPYAKTSSTRKMGLLRQPTATVEQLAALLRAAKAAAIFTVPHTRS